MSEDEDWIAEWGKYWNKLIDENLRKDIFGTMSKEQKKKLCQTFVSNNTSRENWTWREFIKSQQDNEPIIVHWDFSTHCDYIVPDDVADIVNGTENNMHWYAAGRQCGKTNMMTEKIKQLSKEGKLKISDKQKEFLEKLSGDEWFL